MLLELVSPFHPEDDCTITNLVAKRACTLYHICFWTKNLDADIKELKAHGFRRVGKIITSDVYGYEVKGAFLYSMGMGLIELVEECDMDEPS